MKRPEKFKSLFLSGRTKELGEADGSLAFSAKDLFIHVVDETEINLGHVHGCTSIPLSPEVSTVIVSTRRNHSHGLYEGRAECGLTDVAGLQLPSSPALVTSGGNCSLSSGRPQAFWIAGVNAQAPPCLGSSPCAGGEEAAPEESPVCLLRLLLLLVCQAAPPAGQRWVTSTIPAFKGIDAHGVEGRRMRKGVSTQKVKSITVPRLWELRSKKVTFFQTQFGRECFSG